MADAVNRQQVVTGLTNAGKAMGLLAQDDTVFRALVDAFRAADAESFQRLLGQFKIPDCELVCFWLRSKEIVLECLELCGPPREAITAEDIPALAELVVKITSDEELVERLADAVRDRDSKGFASLINQLRAQKYCHLLCHWALIVRWRLVCEIVCSPRPVPVRELDEELAAAGAAVGGLLRDKARLATVIKAAVAFDCATLNSVFGQQGDCFYLCEWICSWRCILVCLPFCRPFPLLTDTSIEEMRAFAQAAARLAAKEGAYASLVDAVLAQNAEAFATLVKQLEVAPFCLQLCHWICFTLCRLFCICVCPPQNLFPQFTSIGGYDYLSNINSALGGNGLTIGDNRAFFDTLRLNGILTQTLFGLPMEYRFETATTDAAGNPTGAWTPVLPNQIAKTLLGHWERHIPVPPFIETKKYIVNAPPLADEIAATISVDGWIQVPQENNWMSPAGAFVSNGNMIELITQTLALFTAQDETATVAGGPAKHPLVQDLYFGIRMRVRQQGVPASETDGGTCVHVAIDDTLYNNILLHPDWDGGPQTVPPLAQLPLAVCMLDIAELKAHPCGQIGDTLTVLFTAAHPNLGSVGISMTGPGGPYGFTLPVLPEVGDYYGTATPTFVVSKLKPCAYLVTLQVTLLLTDGDNAPNPLYDQIAFCKS
ncbi:MAG TPA: hypothetical protein VJV74_04005 [Terriglobia bacterium]|nr:hypothetical protein [Terriglobia bacterium]